MIKPSLTAGELLSDDPVSIKPVSLETTAVRTRTATAAVTGGPCSEDPARYATVTH